MPEVRLPVHIHCDAAFNCMITFFHPDFILIVAQGGPVLGHESSTQEPATCLFLFPLLHPLQWDHSKKANMLHSQ